MPTWHLSADQSRWEYRDGSRVINTMRFEAGAYRDLDGANLGNNFNKAKAAVEKGITIEAQGRLTL